MTGTHADVTRVAVNADVVGYSRLLADDREATSASMAAVRDLVHERVSAFRGDVTSFIGDNFMAVFDDAMDAVQASIEITHALEARNEDIDPVKRIVFRIGIDQGRIDAIDGDVEGETLNIASRIQGEALPGGISVSGAVYRALDEPALRFRPTGEHRLKNLPDPIEIYQFVGLPSHAEGRRIDTLSLEAPTLALLPIHTDSVDDDIGSLGLIVRADLLHRLTEIPQVVVVNAADSTASAPSAARYMLETGIYQFGEHIRIFATLFDVTTMNAVKSLKWATTRSEVIDLSETIAAEVARAVEVEVVIGAPAGLYSELEDPEAIEKVYLGWYHMRSDTREGWDEAVRLFGDVARSHPDMPYGLVLEAYALWIGAANGWTPDPTATFHEVRELVRRAAEIGDPTGMAQALDAAALMSLGDIDGAVTSMEDLEIIRPTCDVTFALEGSVRRYLGEWEAAVDLLDVAMRLTGVNKPWYPTVKACSLFIGGRLEEAVSVAEGVLEVQPNNLEALLVLSAAQHELGLTRRADATAAEIRRRFPATDIGATLDTQPYQDTTLMDRWRDDLAALDLITH